MEVLNKRKSYDIGCFLDQSTYVDGHKHVLSSTLPMYPYKYLCKTKLKDLEINKVVIGVASLATNTPSTIKA